MKSVLPTAALLLGGVGLFAFGWVVSENETRKAADQLAINQSIKAAANAVWWRNCAENPGCWEWIKAGNPMPTPH